MFSLILKVFNIYKLKGLLTYKTLLLIIGALIIVIPILFYTYVNIMEFVKHVLNKDEVSIRNEIVKTINLKNLEENLIIKNDEVLYMKKINDISVSTLGTFMKNKQLLSDFTIETLNSLPLFTEDDDNVTTVKITPKTLSTIRELDKSISEDTRRVIVIDIDDFNKASSENYDAILKQYNYTKKILDDGVK